MLLSLRWLQEFVDISAVSVDELAHILTMGGFEVEAIDEIGSQWDDIIVGEVLESSQHPNADKLTINTVITGLEKLQVVCGAPNVQAGQKVALALQGAKFPSGLVIKRSKIRGQLSEGMICSAEELCIGEEDGGILVLDSSLTTGTPLADALDLRDTILEIGLTPNRSDCQSVIAMAREVAALLDRPLKVPRYSLPENGPVTADKISIDIQAPEACPRYCAGYADNITIEPSPLWMQQRLENSGIRSINNIVDITNYVLLEWGQPLHAFDFETLTGAKIIVRQADNEETFTTLDDTTHTLPSGALMICDAQKPRALAGIMGGLDSSISNDTTSVLFESAYFNPASIAATGRNLGTKTEASQRFEKGIDPEITLTALKRAASLVDELKAGSMCKSCIDHCPAPVPEKPNINICLDTVNKKLGLTLDAETVAGYLTRLNMRVETNGKDCLDIVPPSYRYDINTQMDIVEEIARMVGYDEIPVTYPVMSLVSPRPNVDREAALRIRTLLTSSGFSEVINYSFQDPEVLCSLGFNETDVRCDPVQLLNPLSTAQSVLRTTILGSLLQNLQHNLHANRCPLLTIFELSNVFLKTPEGGVDERRMLSGLAYGDYNTETWAYTGRAVDIFDIKGCIETVLRGMNIRDFHFETGSDEPYLSPQTGIRIFAGNEYCGVCGTIHPNISEGFGAEAPVHVFELDFNILLKYHSEHKKYEPFSRYPAVQRDLALVVDATVTAEQISSAMAGFKNKLLKQWHIFDFYQGKSIESGKKSIAFRMTFQSDERTLTDSEVNKIHDKLLDSLRKQLGVELR